MIVPRVLAVIPGTPDGLSMPFCRRQVASLKAIGISVESFYITSRTAPTILAREWKRFRETVQAYRPNIVHAHYGTVTGMFCALATTLPLVITYRGSDLNPRPTEGRVRTWVGYLMSQIAALRAQSLVCVSDQLAARLWWRQKRAIVLPSGIDMSLFYPRLRSEARGELQWPDSDRVVVFNGGKSPQSKRLDIAEAAVAAATRIMGPIRLHVLDGQTPPAQVPVILAASDCLILASDFEGSPNIVKEALACGLPVITTEVGDVRRYIDSSGPSRVVPQDPEVMAHAVVDVIANRKREPANESIQAIAEGTIAGQLVQLYQKMLPVPLR